MVNLAKGFDELGAGLLRQVDIGGRAYEGAMVKEGEARAESRALSAERRAKTALLDTEARRERAAIRGEIRRADEWDRQQLSLEETTKRSELRGDTRFTQRLKEEGVARLGLLEDELDLRQKQWQDQYDIKSTATIEAAEDKAKITALKLRYEKAQSAYESLVKEFGGDPTSEGFKYAYRAQQDALQAWNDFSQVSGLKMQINPEIDRLHIRTVQAVFAEVAQSIRTDEEWEDFVKALQQQKGGALEDAEKTISDAVKDLGITLPKKEREKMVVSVIESFIKSPNIRDGGNGDVTDPKDPPVGLEEKSPVTPNPTTEGIEKVQGSLSEQLSTIESQIPELENQYKSVSEQRAKEKAAYNHSGLLRRIFEGGMQVNEVQSAYKNNPDLFKDGKGDAISLDRALRIWATNQTFSALQIKIRDLKNRAAEIKIEIQKYENLGATPQASNMMGSKNRGMIAAVDQGISPQEFAYWEPEATDARAKAMQRTA